MSVKGCKYPEMNGDGFCNDENNNIHCNFDGGDCCYSLVIDTFCSKCLCLTGNDTQNYGEINPVIGDGYCDDEANTELHNYDGGDCCGPCVVTDRCSNCTCLDR